MEDSRSIVGANCDTVGWAGVGVGGAGVGWGGAVGWGWAEVGWGRMQGVEEGGTRAVSDHADGSRCRVTGVSQGQGQG